MKRYELSFEFVETEEDAKSLCSKITARLNDYARRHYKPSYHPWESEDHKQKLFIVWYHY